MNPEDQKYKKIIAFKIIIIVIIAAIFFLWLLNLKNIFETNQASNDKTWQKISSDINSSLDRMDKVTNNLASSSSAENSFVEELMRKASSTMATTTSTSTAQTEIKEELTGLIKTATTTPKRISCPEYINCMPTIGEAKTCVVPAGCEKITQIAY
jgi:predicted PurR-regulated permease PerM